MAKRPTEGWTVRAIGVSFDEKGERHEKPFEEFTEEERHEMAVRMNRVALKAAGYVPVEGKEAKAI